jgi:transposase
MFLRIVKVAGSSGTVHEYVRVVTSVREHGKVRQKVIANLGRRDTLQALWPQLQRLLQGEGDASHAQVARQLSLEGDVEIVDASTWGPALVVRALADELGLCRLLDQSPRRPRLIAGDDPHDDWVSRVLVLLANRLTQPASEHGLAAWLESYFVCDRRGRRYTPVWKRHHRVQVDFTQLMRWYRTLDHLILNKDEIEVGLYQRLRDLFDIEPELVLYDLTSTYFEGHGPAMARHGHSRDGKPRNVQVVVGVVMVAGWPITHHVWAGNTRDVTTVPEVLLDLAQRFHFRRVVFVGDRGMVSEKNLGVLRGEAAGTEAAGHVTVEAVEGSCSEEDSARAGEASEAGCNQEDSAETAACEEPQGEGTETSIPGAPRVTAAEATRELKRLQVTCGYLLGMVRRRNTEVEKLIDRVKEDAWIDCPGGINAQEKASSPRTRVQEVPGDRAGVRCFVIASDERREYEQRQREKTMRRAREALAKVARRVTLGRLKDPAKIGAAVERALQRHYGYRYYAWELKEGLLRITEHPVRLAQEKKYEGKYLLQTDQAEITATEAVHQYKQLAEVERAFRTIKDPLSLHPINHRAEHRVRAHIFVAALAFLLDRLLERRLKASQTNLSTGDAWSALETIRHVTFRVQGEHRTGVTPGSSRARQVLKALAITDLRPPTPPQGKSTTM